MNGYDLVFTLCVQLLLSIAMLLDPFWPGGMNYEKINVIIFCIIWPIFSIVSLAINFILAYKLYKISKRRIWHH